MTKGSPLRDYGTDRREVFHGSSTTTRISRPHDPLHYSQLGQDSFRLNRADSSPVGSRLAPVEGEYNEGKWTDEEHKKFL